MCHKRNTKFPIHIICHYEQLVNYWRQYLRSESDSLLRRKKQRQQAVVETPPNQKYGDDNERGHTFSFLSDK